MSEEKSSNSSNIEPKIYKQEEFDLMLELIENGLWRNVNLTKALHIDEKTIIEWKKRSEAQQAHRRAILKFIKRRTDVDKILKELEMEIEPDITALVQNNYYQLNDEQLNAVIQSKSRQIGTHSAIRGEAEENSGESS